MYENSNPRLRFVVLNELADQSGQGQVLIKLYQPLIGALGVALYQTLVQGFDPYRSLSASSALYSLQEDLDCSLRQLWQALHKLEAVGLLKTYVSHNLRLGDILAFKLHAVPEASEFFNTSLLASLLKEKVGGVRFSQLSREFAKQAQVKERQLDNLEEVSASFFEVFRLPENEAINPSEDVQKAAEENAGQKTEEAQVNLKQIDWQYLKDRFVTYQIPESEIDRQKDEIRSIMELYGLSEEEFINETLPTLHGSYQLDAAAIRKSLNYNYKADHRRKQVIKRQEEKQDRPSVNQQDQQLLDLVKSKSPVNFLDDMKREKGGFTTARERQIVYDLRENVGLEMDLINVLVYTCLNYQPVLTQDLAYRIANDWLQKGITTPEAAIKYLRAGKKQAQSGQKKNYPAYSGSRRLEQGTDWNKKQVIQPVNISDEDLRKMLQGPDKKEK
ncbi:helicase DnaB [Lactobacillus delbrueckii]|uniref:DnaD domain protein n=1 Tax=Lactobacillus delbrueckii TaxID=1584 RepID=UPI001C704556|nr:DnaD domain protein [Lactobacillus delbrueckii]MBW9308400.1 helicase DnaB [Lactobacillus delbrueckii]